MATRECPGMFNDFIADHLTMRVHHSRGDRQGEVEHACHSMKKWIVVFTEAPDEADCSWMVRTFISMCSRTRKLAMELDKGQREMKFLKKFVEIFREFFQKLIKEKAKRLMLLWVSCELLRAYFVLAQVSQCSFLLSALKQQYQKEGFDPHKLPKSIAVTFYFFWGKHAVFDNSYKEAEEKLTWAFKHCHPNAHSNKRRILTYLIPVKLRFGVLPSQEMLAKYELHGFVELIKAIKEGNMRMFTRQLDAMADELIRSGTFLLMERHKLLVYRNLCKRVYAVGKDEFGNKLPLVHFELALSWQDDCDEDETACILSNLIFQGAIKGYMSYEHKKIVFSKENPFPAVSTWK